MKETLKFDDYKKCLDNGKNIYKEQMVFRSKKHDVFTMNVNKTALNREDDKRLIQEDGVSTLAW